MQTIEYRTIDKSTWGIGPWLDEPDKRQWMDEASGLPCLIKRGPSGALCGYVGLPPEHPLFGHDCDGIDVDVHGGLTYAAPCAHGEDEASGICHRPGSGEPDNVHWLGFDCAHWTDLSPYFASLFPNGHMGEIVTYRDLGYVTAEVTSLAAQLKAFDQDAG